MSSVSIRKRSSRTPITETLDDVDWRFDIVLAGEDGFEIREIGLAKPWPLKLEYDTGDGWKPLGSVGNQVAYFPPGTFIRRIGCVTEPNDEKLARAEELRRV